MRRAALPALALLPLLAAGCEKRDIPVFGYVWERDGAAKRKAPAEEVPARTILKGRAPLAPEEIRRLMENSALILDAALLKAEDLETRVLEKKADKVNYRIPKEELREQQEKAAAAGTTTVVRRRLVFRTLREIRGRLRARDFVLEDRDCRVDFPGEPGQFFYRVDPDAAVKYGIFCDGPTFAESREILVVRMQSASPPTGE